MFKTFNEIAKTQDVAALRARIQGGELSVGRYQWKIEAMMSNKRTSSEQVEARVIYIHLYSNISKIMYI